MVSSIDDFFERKTIDKLLLSQYASELTRHAVVNALLQNNHTSQSVQ